MAGNAQVGMGTFVSILLGTLSVAGDLPFGGHLGGFTDHCRCRHWLVGQLSDPDAPADKGTNQPQCAAGSEYNLGFAREVVIVLLHYGHFLVLAVWRQL